jgi:hypothetical protein
MAIPQESWAASVYLLLFEPGPAGGQLLGFVERFYSDVPAGTATIAIITGAVTTAGNLGSVLASILSAEASTLSPTKVSSNGVAICRENTRHADFYPIYSFKFNFFCIVDAARQSFIASPP